MTTASALNGIARCQMVADLGLVLMGFAWPVGFCEAAPVLH